MRDRHFFGRLSAERDGGSLMKIRNRITGWLIKKAVVAAVAFHRATLKVEQMIIARYLATNSRA